jgi:hypothetical protein
LTQAERVLPSQGALHDQLLNYIDELPVTAFVTDTLSDELQAAVFVDDASTKKLTEFEGYEDPTIVAQRLVASLETLPHKYKLTVRLPTEVVPIMKDGEWRTEFAPGVTLVRGGPELSELCPLDTDDENARTGPAMGLLSLLNPKPKWDVNALYLQIDALGFIGIYGGSLPHSQAVQKVKEFCGLGLGLRLFEVRNSYTLATPPSSMFLHRSAADEKWILSATIPLDADLSRALSTIRLSKLEAWTDVGKRTALTNLIFAEMRVVLNLGRRLTPYF